MMMHSEHTSCQAVSTAEDKKLAQELFDQLKAETSDGVGITRLAYGEKESLALDLVEAKARALGLKTERDAGANLVITLEGREKDTPFLAFGSHLDSVVQGGNYDGGAGVVAGLAILAGFKRDGFTPRRTIKLYALRGEESARFGKAYMGSLALLGKLTPADLAVKDSGSGETLAQCMRAVGADVDRIEKGEALFDVTQMALWLELHIEQGPVLIAKKSPVGIVTGIRGNYRHRKIECIGEAGHSGAVPRWLRHDAVFASADLVTRLDRRWNDYVEQGKDIVVTCGIFGTDPKEHAITRIPGNVEFSFDVRSQNKTILDEFHALFLAECKAVGQERGVEFTVDRRVESAPAVMDDEWVKRLKKAARGLGLPDEEVPSGAGHDAAVFSNAGVPSAMVFVRNSGGSHNPKESMKMDDFLAGVAVMRAAMKEAAQ